MGKRELDQQPNLGLYLKEARLRAGLSQADVAAHLGLQTPQSISDWERNHGSATPMPALKRLIRLYRLDEEEVFKLVLEFQYNRLREKLAGEFYPRALRRGKR